MKFKKKPVVIDAIEWTGNIEAIDEWIQSFDQNPTHVILWDEDDAKNIQVKTLEGTSYTVPIGYYIIRGVKGEFYPCEAEIFAETYGRVDNENGNATALHILRGLLSPVLSYFLTKDLLVMPEVADNQQMLEDISKMIIEEEPIARENLVHILQLVRNDNNWK